MLDSNKLDITVSLVALMVSCAVAALVSFFVWVFPNFFSVAEIRAASHAVPYTGLELAGRDIYIREGCSYCHTQMVRPIEEDVLRYGPATKEEDDIYEYTHLWGSKRTGPDLTNIGLKYSDQWHEQHLRNPQRMVARSIMPPYPWLFNAMVSPEDVMKKMIAMRRLGVPYSDDDISQAKLEVKNQTEADALIAYLQSLKPTIDSHEVNR
jgi:cytochrome c oxidase cbb3-type subunit 2